MTLGGKLKLNLELMIHDGETKQEQHCVYQICGLNHSSPPPMKNVSFQGDKASLHINSTCDENVL